MSWYASVLEEKIYKCVSFIDLYDRGVVAGENSSFITSAQAVCTLEKALSSVKDIP